jgi:ribulose-5-phosphate 4-epimerase/fuculose-1-phosphate aldolase
MSVDRDEAALLDQVITDLVDANPILLHHQVVDSFGHISVRHPARPDRFLMSRRIAPGLVTREGVREFGLDGELIDKDGTPAFLERYIHSAIYAARPDVNSVIHSHSHSVIPFGVIKNRPLRPICHTGKFIGEGLPIFEIRDVAGDCTNLLITNQELGVALAKSLGDHAVVLMRGHGSTAVGSSIQQAVYRAIYVEVNAQVLATALAIGGEITYLSPGECVGDENVSADAMKRTWDYWKSLAAQG